MTETQTFDCTDCGSHVTRFWMFDGEPKRCYVCRFIREAPETDRHELRMRLMSLRQLQYWSQVGSYRDENYPERLCDHCEKPYRGPAVYCCQRCALTEAA